MHWLPRSCGRARMNRAYRPNSRWRVPRSRRPNRQSKWRGPHSASLSAWRRRDCVSIPERLITQLPAEHPEQPLAASANPHAAEQNAVVAEAQSQLKALHRTYYPQFSAQGLAGVRGSGMLPDGGRLGGANGLAPTTQNYSLGLTVTFPVMDKFALREQEAEQAANIRAGQAQYSLITTTVQAQFDTAVATLAGARRVAANTPVEVSSARVSLDQATARYRAGLAQIDDVAQAQRLLAQAQIDDALARLNVWRARLEIETARGNIQPFISEVSP